MTPAAQCRSVSVEYGAVRAVDSVDLLVAAGETLAVLGPSGSGKSTLIYAIAGFLPISGGTIEIAGETVSTRRHLTPPERRSVGLVFQNYALWPHMSALDTVAFPLLRSGKTRTDSYARAHELLSIVGVEELAERRPAEMSGGQQQRVGLARALARDAGLYLFDEPTAHLDAPIRQSVQAEISRRRADTGAAAIYATHDFEEALSVADRLVIIREGAVVQKGSPTTVYDQPVDEWAARLTGPISALRAEVITTNPGGSVVDIAGCRVNSHSRREAAEREVTALVRPDWTHPNGQIDASVEAVFFRGTHTDYHLSTSAGPLISRLPGKPELSAGDRRGWTITRAWIP